MYVCMSAYKHAYVCVSVYVCINVCVCIVVFIYASFCFCIYVWMYVFIWMYIPAQFLSHKVVRNAHSTISSIKTMAEARIIFYFLRLAKLKMFSEILWLLAKNFISEHWKKN